MKALSARAFVLYVVLLALLISSIEGAEVSITDLIDGLPNMARLLGEMFPPSVERIQQIGLVLLETLQMAVAGAAIGIVISFFLAVLAARNQTPHMSLYYGSRGLIALFRTVPDLIWAVFFVATVGLGPFAGVLALVVDTIGFCGRFFAESMEETDPGPQEALTAGGAGRSAVVFAAVLPAAFPSFINTSLFALEKAVRSSVVLGLVGAGGIGIELKVSMDLFRYDEAATIILCILALVLVVEQIGARLRRRFL